MSTMTEAGPTLLQAGARSAPTPILIGLGLILLAALLAALALGPVPIPVRMVLQAMLVWLGVDDAAITRQTEQVLFSIRLPRALLAVAVGAALSSAGAAMQGLFRNPLADPGLIGVSSGAAFAAVATIVLGHNVLHALDESQRPWVLPVVAFLGGLIATFVVLRLSARHGRASVAALLLAGVAINALCGAGIGLLTYVADDLQLRSLVFWTMGSLGSATWRNSLPALPLIVLPTVLLWRYARRLDVFALGEREAGHLGVAVERMKWQLALLVAVSTGAAVAVCGIIGFMGLVVPHLLRLAFGPGHRLVLPGSALLGGAMLASADIVSRLAVVPAELPIGVVTALVGGPFFLWLLVRIPLRGAA